MAAHEAGRVRAAIGRGSDFFGLQAHQSTVGDQVFARALAEKPVQVLGDPDLPHTVTYIEDFARALVTLGEREEALGQVWHVPNDEAVTIRRFVEMVFTEVGRPPHLRAAPRWGLTLAGLFNPTLRAVREQLYQSERPWVVDASKFERTFGWRATPLQEAIGATSGSASMAWPEGAERRFPVREGAASDFDGFLWPIFRDSSAPPGVDRFADGRPVTCFLNILRRQSCMAGSLARLGGSSERRSALGTRQVR
jgi:hypothetical protein